MSNILLDSYQVRAGRSLLGVTQNELATASGISLATLNNIERGIANPRKQTLEMLLTSFREAGLSFEESGTIQALYFNRFGRPGSYDPLISQETLIRYLNPDNLLKARKIMFFTFCTQKGARLQIGVLLDCVRRYILLDHMQFFLDNTARIEMLGNLMLQAFTLYSEQIFFCHHAIDNINNLTCEQVVAFLKTISRGKMRHPEDIFKQIENWKELLTPFMVIQDHPIRRLFVLLKNLSQEDLFD